MGSGSLIVLKWADGEYAFKLAGKQIEELQRVCGTSSTMPVGIGAIAQRVFAQQFFYSDIFHTIRLGLIGGGLAPVRAQQLVDTYVDGKALAEPDDPSSPLRTAQAILEDLLFDLGDLSKQEESKSGEREAAEMASSTLRSSEHRLSS